MAYDAVDTCAHCHGNRAEPGTPIETCERCGGAGQLRAVSNTAFGQLVRAQACDVCGGEGKVAQTPCRECSGAGRKAARRTLEVDLPPGIADGQRVRLTGRGHAGDRGGPAGDLYVMVSVREDERFLRDGNDLVSVIDVPAPAAALGTTVTVATLDGEEEIEVEAGTQPGTVVTLRGRGMPTVGRGRGRSGDQQVVLNVVIPRNLTDRQRELLVRAGRQRDRGEPARGDLGVAVQQGPPGAALRCSTRVLHLRHGQQASAAGSGSRPRARGGSGPDATAARPFRDPLRGCACAGAGTARCRTSGGRLRRPRGPVSPPAAREVQPSPRNGGPPHLPRARGRDRPR
ncbi:MAG: DnaJ C-terminal domain-containing protein [Thermoleophilaceae bacterium]